MQLPIYLDYAASTPLDQRVLAKMLPFLSQQQGFGNPSSNHFYGRQAAEAIEQARLQVANFINCQPAEIIWTSGATEANNLAIKGIAYAKQKHGKHIITLQSEHSSVLDTCKQLAAEGFLITYLSPEKDGLLDLDKLQKTLRPDTVLVSITQVNNEIGVIQDIMSIGEIVRRNNLHTYLHTDAVQSVGKIKVDMALLPVDLMSFSGHKLYAPKGIGALYINQQRQVNLQPLFNGGGQERGIRPGTLATQQIVGMGEAFAIMQQDFIDDNLQIKNLSERFWQGLSTLNEVYLNGAAATRVPHILNVAFGGVLAKMLLPALKDLAVATGSACHANSASSSHVLQALAVPAELINNSIRFSFGRFSTAVEIDFAVAKIIEVVNKLRQI